MHFRFDKYETGEKDLAEVVMVELERWKTEFIWTENGPEKSKIKDMKVSFKSGIEKRVASVRDKCRPKD